MYRLFIPADIWNRAFGELVTGRRQLAWGRIVRSYHGDYCDLIVRRMRYSTELPDGNDHSVVFDWLLLDAPTEESTDDIIRKLNHSHVRPGQLLVYVKPGIGDQHDRWIGSVVEKGAIRPLRKICLVGPGMKSMSRLSRKRLLVPAEQTSSSDSQWSRFIGSIGQSGFRRFRNTKVLLLGTGGLGSLLASTLVRSGLRDLTMVDHDILENHNRDRTFGNTPQDVGMPKAEILAHYLHSIRPSAKITAIKRRIEDELIIDRFRRASVVFTCLDNDQSRAYASNLCAELLKVHIDLGTLVGRRDLEPRNPPQTDLADRIIAADVRLILPGACLGCVGGLQNEVGVAQDWNSGGRVGSLTSINHIAVGTAKQLYLDLLTEKLQSSYWQRIEWVQGQGLRVAGNAVTGNPKCPICGKW